MSDLIKREDAIKAVEMFFKDAYIEDSDVHCTDMEYEINHIPAASPWHRVEEEPKEPSKQYVVWASKGYAYCDKWLGDRWLISSVAPGTVTHWMPIEPPKEGKDA